MTALTTRLALILALIGLAGCETARGMGRDLQNVGDALVGR